ncbi:MAG: hypothetical protein FWC76_08395 [Defluviitaleaceae bacterium]|nr:hypothetical protein [Defluviitaleaceae bacterium]
MKNKIIQILLAFVMLLLAACNSQPEHYPNIEAETEKDDDQDIFGWEYTDFIIATNGNETIEPVKLREGDKFLGLTLESLSPAIMLTKNNEFYASQGMAEFSGEIVVRGDLVLWGSEWRSGILKHDFIAHELYRSRFPMMVNGRGGGAWFHIENEEDLLAMLGVPHYTEENNRGARFDDITIRINNYTILEFDKGVEDTAVIVEAIAWQNGELPTEFITLPNGTRVDVRVDDETVDLIFRHFEAVENGDVVAFRETLQGQDGISGNNHVSQILAHFWDIVVGDYADEMFFEGGSYIDLTQFGSNRIFHENFPAVSRNTDLHVAEIRKSYGHWGLGVEVTTINNEQEKAVYIMHLLRSPDWVGVDLRFRACSH